MLGDWCGHMPEYSDHEDVTPPPTRTVRLPRRSGGAFVVELEWDDGNGMWISPACRE